MLTEKTRKIFKDIVEHGAIGDAHIVKSSVLLNAFTEVDGLIVTPKDDGSGVSVDYDGQLLTVYYGVTLSKSTEFNLLGRAIDDPKRLSVPRSHHARQMVQKILDHNSAVT